MKLLLLFIVALQFTQAYAQKEETDTITTDKYKLIRVNTGLQVGVGLAKYYYGDKTTDWIGDHGSPVFAVAMYFGKHNIGGRFKPWTVNPNGNLVFGSDTLTNRADLNVIKEEVYYGYDFEVVKRLIIEPQITFTTTSFTVVNEDELGKKFSIPSASGFAFGVDIKKYFRVGNFEYLIVCLGLQEALVNYNKVNSNLDNNYFSWDLGLKFGGWFRRKEAIKK